MMGFKLLIIDYDFDVKISYGQNTWKVCMHEHEVGNLCEMKTSGYCKILMQF